MKNKKCETSESSVSDLLKQRDIWIVEFIKQFGESSIGDYLFYFSKEEQLFIDYIKKSRLLMDSSQKLINVYTFKNVYKDIFRDMDPVFRIDFNNFVKQLDEFSFGFITSNKWESNNEMVGDVGKWKRFRQKLSEINKRDELVACLLFSTRFSVEGICRIKTENFNPVGNFFFFPKKNGDFKIVPIPRSLSLRINDYIKNKTIDSPYLFSTNQGKALTRARITFVFKEVAKRNTFVDKPKITPKYLKFLCRSLKSDGFNIDDLVK